MLPARRKVAYCRLSEWLSGEGQSAAGATVGEWGGTVRADGVHFG